MIKWSKISSFYRLYPDWHSLICCNMVVIVVWHHYSSSSSAPSATNCIPTLIDRAGIIIAVIFIVIGIFMGVMSCIKPSGSDFLLPAEDWPHLVIYTIGYYFPYWRRWWVWVIIIDVVVLSRSRGRLPLPRRTTVSHVRQQSRQQPQGVRLAGTD